MLRRKPCTGLRRETGLERREGADCIQYRVQIPMANAVLKSQIFPEAEPVSKDLTRDTCRINAFPEG